MRDAKRVHRRVFGALFIAAGTLHFLVPSFYLRIMPPFLPAPLELVYLSGVLEILGGVGLFLPRFQRAAAWGLALLLLAFLPVHVFMLLEPAAVGVEQVAPVLLWLRLAFQFALIGWIFWIVT